MNLCAVVINLTNAPHIPTTVQSTVGDHEGFVDGAKLLPNFGRLLHAKDILPSCFTECHLQLKACVSFVEHEKEIAKGQFHTLRVSGVFL